MSNETMTAAPTMTKSCPGCGCSLGTYTTTIEELMLPGACESCLGLPPVPPAQSAGTLLKIVCGQCGTAAYLPGDKYGYTLESLTAAGWATNWSGKAYCSLCNALGKETKAEAAQAYDAETLSRLWDLGSRLRIAGQLDPVAIELVEHAWAALDWVLRHSGERVHGLGTGQVATLRDSAEAL